MPAARKLPDDTTLRRLHETGATTTSIAAQYGCSPGAVSYQWARLGLESRRTRHHYLLPWRIGGNHTHAIEATYLRLLSRMAKGERVTDRRASSAYNWALRLQNERLSIHYHSGVGFFTAPSDFRSDRKVTVKTERGNATFGLGSVPK